MRFNTLKSEIHLNYKAYIKNQILPHREQAPSVNTVYENNQGWLRKFYETNTLCVQKIHTYVYDYLLIFVELLSSKLNVTYLMLYSPCILYKLKLKPTWCTLTI
jgi:hypothetical protein